MTDDRRIRVVLMDPEGNEVAEAMMGLPAPYTGPDPLELPVSHEDAALIRAADSGSSMEGRRQAGAVMTRALVACLAR
jgi:hypothetical protein